MLSVDDVNEILAVPLLGVIPESQAVLKASNLGEPVVMDDESDAGQPTKTQLLVCSAKKLTSVFLLKRKRVSLSAFSEVNLDVFT